MQPTDRGLQLQKSISVLNDGCWMLLIKGRFFPVCSRPQSALVPPLRLLATDTPHLCSHPPQRAPFAGLSPCAHRARLPQACLALVPQFLQVPGQPSSDLGASKRM